MRNLSSIVALVAALGGAMAAPLAPAAAQDASTAARLRAAVGQAQPLAVQGASEPVASFTTDELNQLVAPIALYPDALLAQVLVASTFPDQVSDAGDLIQRAPGMSDSALSDAVAAGHWDESVLVLLSGFPTVLGRMAADMDWTRRLGDAVTNDDPAVMSAVQHMRGQAVATGNLSSNRAQVVNTGSSGISIRSADPKVVYVPEYDPVKVYSTRDVAYAGPAPAASTGFSPIVAGALGFGAGFLVSNLFDDNHHDDDHWSGYWQRDDVFNWNSGGFYPRPGPGAPIWAPPPGGGRMPPPPPPPPPGGWNNGPGPRPPAPFGGGAGNGPRNGSGQNQHGQNQHGQNQHGQNQHGPDRHDQKQNGPNRGNAGPGGHNQNAGKDPRGDHGQQGKPPRNSGQGQGNSHNGGQGNNGQNPPRKHPPQNQGDGANQGNGARQGNGGQGRQHDRGQNQQGQDNGKAKSALYCLQHPKADACQH